jgi:hypothetical protein
VQDRAHDGGEREAESLAAPSSPRGMTLEGRVLALQRSAGNRAVGRMLRSRRQLQRFVGWEHERIGNAGSMAQCRSSDPSQCRTSPILIEVAPGVRLTWGQVVALAGDEFETVEELQFYAAAASPSGAGDDATRGRLRAAMRHDLDWRPAGTNAIPAGLYDGGDAARRASESHFNELAMRNVDHFPDDHRAEDAWRRHHHWAVVEALEAGRGSSGRSLNQAYLYEAFGDHFLTDMFSAGHIRTPRSRIVSWYENTWRPRAKDGVKWFLLGQYLQHQFIPPERMLELYRTYGPTLDSALDLLFSKLTPAVSGAVSGTIHDYEGDHGVLVTAPIAFGAQWTTYGDASLPGASGRGARTSGRAESLAVAAIGAARNHLDIAFEVGRQIAAEGAGGSTTDMYRRLEQRGVTYPYTEVMNFVPRAIAGGTPVPWSHWRWGQMDRWMYDQVNAYARDKIDSRRAGIVGSIPNLTIQINDNPPFNVPQAVDNALRTFAADPLGVIGNLIVWPALDPQFVPATTTP